MTTALDAILAKRSAKPSEPDAEDSPTVTGGEGSQEEPSGSEQDDAEFTTTASTPSGIEVKFIGGDKHEYFLRFPEKEGWEDFVKVPAVSDLKDVLDKPAITRWYGGSIAEAAVTTDTWQAIKRKSGDEAAIKYLKQYPYEHRDKAAKRGTSVHNGMEYWAQTGELPKPEVYDESERGYVEGLLAFLTESKIVCHAAEVMVGSVENGYAGRFDLDGVLMDDVELVTHLTPKGRGTKREKIPAGRHLWDLKTSSGVYLDMFFQLEYYNQAYWENGYGEPFDHKYIVRVTDDGRYEVVESKADWIDCLHLKGLWDGLQRMKGRA